MDDSDGADGAAAADTNDGGEPDGDDAPIVDAEPSSADDHLESGIENRLDALGEAIGALRRALPATDLAARLVAQVDALPDTLAARLGIEASTAALGVRIGGLNSAIEQLKLAGQSAAEQTRSTVDEPRWLPTLVGHLDALAGAIRVREETEGAQRQELRKEVASLADRLQTLERTADEVHALADAVAEVVHGAAVERAAQEAGLQALRSQLGGLAELPDRLTEIGIAIDDLAVAPEGAARMLAVAELLEKQAGADAISAAFERMEQRDRSLAARIDRLFEMLGPDADHRPEAADAVVPALDGLAAATDDLAALVASSAARVEERLAALDARLDAVEQAATAAMASRADHSATLALLRAERAIVQTKLQEERDAWEED